MVKRAIKNVSYDFTDQVVLITGGARGQGRSHALAFAAAGATVVVADICEQIESIDYPLATPADLAQTVAMIEQFDVRALGRQVDVRDAAQVKALVAETIAQFGRIDILVSNAGVDRIEYIADLEEDAWDDVVDTHLRGAYLVSRAVSAHMAAQGRGKIVIIGSTQSFVGIPGHVHYVAAKTGLLGLVRGLALDLGPHRINVNMVAPGAVESPMNRMLDNHPEWGESLAAMTGSWNILEPDYSKQLLDPQEISQAVMWFASDASDFVTGTSLVVDAGSIIK